MPRDALSELFRTLAGGGLKVRCVVLNACFTDQQADGIAESVPCVVGMRRAIEEDTEAITFACGFYQAVGLGYSVGVAVACGRIQIHLEEGERPDSERDVPELRARLVDPSKFIIPDRGQPLPSETGQLLHGKYLVVGTRGVGLISRADIALDTELERRVLIKTLVEPAARGGPSSARCENSQESPNTEHRVDLRRMAARRAAALRARVHRRALAR